MNLKPLAMRLTGLCILLFSLSAHAEPDGLESRVSARDFAQTVVALRDTLNAASAKIFQEIDHRNNAMGMDIELPHSRVFIFGNPKVGSQLMLCAPLVALDLPMRMLVRRDSDDQTWVYWTRASTLMARYSSSLSEECQALADKVDQNLAGLAERATAAAQ